MCAVCVLCVCFVCFVRASASLTAPDLPWTCAGAAEGSDKVARLQVAVCRVRSSGLGLRERRTVGRVCVSVARCACVLLRWYSPAVILSSHSHKHTHTHTHTLTHSLTHTHARTHAHTHTHTYTNAHTHKCTHAHTHTNAHTYTF